MDGLALWVGLHESNRDEEEEEVGRGFGLGNFIMVMRCQPGIPSCFGKVCKMPAQWKDSVSMPVPVKGK